MDAAYYVEHIPEGTTVHISHALGFYLAEQLAKRTEFSGLDVQGGSERGEVYVSIAHPPRVEKTIMGAIARWGNEYGLHIVAGEVQ